MYFSRLQLLQVASSLERRLYAKAITSLKLCLRIYVRMRMCICVRMCIYVYIYIYTYTRTYTWMACARSELSNRPSNPASKALLIQEGNRIIACNVRGWCGRVLRPTSILRPESYSKNPASQVPKPLKLPNPKLLNPIYPMLS